MLQFCYAALEAGSAAVLLLPILLVLNRIRFHDIKTTSLYFLFTVYLAGVYAVVGFPNVTYVRLEINLNLIPFTAMLSDPFGTILNVILFVPLGIFLSILWSPYCTVKRALLLGFGLSFLIELLQIFTFRATDINDLITNTAGTFIGYRIGLFAGKLFPALKCRSHESDLLLLLLCSVFVMFFFQPLIWSLIY